MGRYVYSRHTHIIDRFLGIPCAAQNSSTNFTTSSLVDTGILFTETRIKSLSSVYYLGIRADGVAAVHSLRRRRFVPWGLYNTKPNVGCAPLDDFLMIFGVEWKVQKGYLTG